MRLDSFTVGYHVAEDRLLLQAIGDGEPQSFWITRRAALMIAQGIQKVLAEQYQKFATQQVNPSHMGDLLAFDHSVATQKNPPKTSVVQEAIKVAPILIYQLSYSAETSERCLINLTDADGNGYGYRLTADMLHALLNLIQSQCDQAGWGIRLLQPVASMGLNIESVH